MAKADANSSDKESDSESSLELEIGSDGTIRPFMFEPQHGTSSGEEVYSDTAQDQPERSNPTCDRVLAIETGASVLIAKLGPRKLKVFVARK